MPTLRPEVLRFEREDGGVDLLDLIFERLISLTPDETRGLADSAPEVIAKLESLFLYEGTVAEIMRRAAWSARAASRPRPFSAETLAGIDWEEARQLPVSIAAEWRSPERLRRLAEERLAGRRYLPLPGFLDEEVAARLLAQTQPLPFVRMDSELVHAERRLLADGELPEWRALMASPILQRLFGAVLGVVLPERLFINAWRLRRDDHFAVHPDGRLYRGTLSLGLCEGWSAAHGGAIAFGDPTPAGFVVRERWLPHLGDALLFAPSHDSWHTVEPVSGDRTRWSLTGWWTASQS